MANSIVESSFDVKNTTITKNHPGYLGSVLISIAHISVDSGSIVFNYGDGSKDTISFKGKDALTFINKNGRERRIGYFFTGIKSGVLKKHYPEWKKNYLI